MSKQCDQMSQKRWARIKRLAPNTSRYLHTSCNVAMLANPDPMKPRIPWIEKPGHTYNVGSNAAKRAKRAAKAHRGAA